MPAFQDITGQRFGRLVAIKRMENKGKNANWIFRCDCGNHKEILSQSVKHGMTKSCGCLIGDKVHNDDLSGQRFGRLIAIERVNLEKKKTYWLCQCDCGNKKVMRADGLKNGHAKSCGCIKIEQIKEYATKHHESSCVNGGSPEYRTWDGMIQRCSNPNNEAYKNYGGRGITVCDRWRDYELFLQDMGRRPPKHTIERINNNGNYEPGNCKWATRREQLRNTRRNNYITDGQNTRCLAEWAELLNVNYVTLKYRISHGNGNGLSFVN